MGLGQSDLVPERARSKANATPNAETNVAQIWKTYRAVLDKALYPQFRPPAHLAPRRDMQRWDAPRGRHCSKSLPLRTSQRPDRVHHVPNEASLSTRGQNPTPSTQLKPWYERSGSWSKQIYIGIFFDRSRSTFGSDTNIKRIFVIAKKILELVWFWIIM